MAKKVSQMTAAERVAYYQSEREKKTAGLDTFNDDLKKVYTDVQSINGWRDADTMAGYGSSVSDMLKRATAYKNYYATKDADYDSTDIDDVIKWLTEAQGFVSDSTSAYSGYKSAQDYDAARAEHEQLSGLSADELKGMMEKIVEGNKARSEALNYQLGDAYVAATDPRINVSITSDTDIPDDWNLLRAVLSPKNREMKDEIVDLSDPYNDEEYAKLAYYYYQKLMEQAKGYTSDRQGEYGNNRQTALNFDYAMLVGDEGVDAAKAQQARASGGYSADFDKTGYKNVTDDERSLYLWLADQVGAEAAQEYYDYLYKTNNKYNRSLADREGERASLEKTDFEKVLSSFGGGLENWWTGNERFVKSLFGQDVSTTANEYEMQYARSSLDGGLGVLYDLGSTFGQMAPSVLAGVLTGGQSAGVSLLTSAATFGVSIYGNAYHEARELGGSHSEAMTYSALTAAAEVALQNLIGGIPGVGQHLSGAWIGKLANKTSNVLLKLSAELAGDMIGEASEEGLQEVLGFALRKWILDSDEDIENLKEDALYAVMLGALSSFGLGGLGNTARYIGYNATGKKYNAGVLKAADGSEIGGSALIEAGLSSDPESDAYTMAKLLSERMEGGKALTNAQLGYLAQAIDEAIKTGKLSNDFVMAKGEEHASLIRDAIGKFKAYIDPNAGTDALMKEESVADAAKTQEDREAIAKKIAAYPNKIAPTDGIDALMHAAGLDVASQEGAEGVSVTKRVAEKENATEGVKTAREETGKASPSSTENTKTDGDGQSRTPVPTSEEADDGSADYSEEAVYADERKKLASAARSVKGSQLAKAYNAENEGADRKSRQNADVYIADYKRVRNLASGGHSMEAVRAMGVAGSLSEAQFAAAYDEGHGLWEKHKDSGASSTSGTRRAGKVYYNGTQGVKRRGNSMYLPSSGVTEKWQRNYALTDDQRAALEFAETVLAPMGVDVVFYSSKSNRSLPSGMYADGRIYIDIEAGMTDRTRQTYVMYAVAHELTHLAEKMSPELWSRYADAVVEILAKEEGVSVSSLIARYQMEQEQAEIARLRRVYPDKKGDIDFLRSKAKLLDEKGAIREIVAEASQLILTRESKFAERLYEKDASICKKIIALVKEAIRKMQSVLQNLRTPDDGVSAHIEKHLDELVGYYDEMMADTLDKAGRTTVEDGEVQFKNAKEYDSEKAGIHDQIRNAQGELNQMSVVFSSSVPQKVGDKEQAGTWAISELKRYGFQADRQGFGKIYFSERDIRDAMNYLDTDAEKISIVALYKVLKRGIQIGEHGNHKMRGKHTVTFAAPIELNGVRGNMAVVVNMRNNQYKVHRILMPDGSMFKFEETKRDAGQESQRGVPKGSLANATSTASNNSILQNPDLSTENAKIPENSDDGQFQYRRVDAETDRQTLAKAAQSMARSERDNEIVRSYLAKLDEYRAGQKELNEISDKLEADNWGEVKLESTERYRLLERRDSLRKTLEEADASLLEMEAMSVLQNLVEKERQKAASATLEAVTTKQTAKAREEKRQARELRVKHLARAERAVSRIYKWATHPTKKDHVPTSLMPLVQQLFEAVDVSHHFAQIEKLEAQRTEVNIRIQELERSGADQATIEAQKAFRSDLTKRIMKLEGVQHNLTWDVRLKNLQEVMSTVENAPDFNVEFCAKLYDDISVQLGKLKTDGKNRLFEASPELLRTYAEALESISHSITEAGRLYGNKRAANTETLAEQSIREFQAEKREAAKVNATAGLRRMFDMDSLNPAYFAKKLGHSTEAVMNELFEGYYQTIANVRVVDDFLDGIREKYKVSTFTGKNEKLHSVKLERGGSVTLTTSQIMTLYALSDRPQAKKHLYGRGLQSFRGDVNEAIRKTQPWRERIGDEFKRFFGKDTADLSEFAKQLFGGADVKSVTEKDVESMIDLLTADQKACVREMKKFLHDVAAPMGNKTSQTLYLYDMFTEENYFPIETVKTFLKMTEKNQKDGDISSRSVFSILNKGFTKTLSEQAGNPIVIRDIFDVFTEHCFDMANYGGLGVAVSDVTRWLGYRQMSQIAGESQTPGIMPEETSSSVREEMKQAWGPGAEAYIKNLLMSIEGELKGTDGARAINKLVRNAKIAAVAANLRVVALQPTAYTRAAVVISPRAMAASIRHSGDIKAMIEEATEHSELMWYKRQGFYDMNNSRSLLEKLKDNASKADKLRELATAPAGMADELTWGTLWRACRYEIDIQIREKNLGVKKNSEEYFKMVRDKFHEVINFTQVIDSPMHKNKLMSDPDTGVKQLTAFMAEPMLTLNMMQSAVDDVIRHKEGGKQRLYRATLVYFTSVAFQAVLASLVDAARDDDDEEGWAEKYGEAILLNAFGVDVDQFKVGKIFAGDWNVLNNVPIVKEVFSLMEGYDPSRMDLSGIVKMMQAVNKVTKFLGDPSAGGWTKFEKTMYSMAQAVSTVTGIPVSNVWRTVKSFVNTIKAWIEQLN